MEPEPEPEPGSSGGAPRTPSAPFARTYVQQCIVLADWWLERVEGEEGKVRVVGISHNPQMRNEASSSKGNRKGAGRMFRSATIVKRHEATAIETEDGYQVRIGRILNIPRMRENGFSQEVCECFELGFPVQWRELVNPNMEQQNEQARSQPESTAHSVEYYREKWEKFLSGSFTYALTEYDFFSSAKYTSNTDGPTTQSTLNLLDGNVGNMAASCGLYSSSKDMPEKPLTPPGETCSGQESDQHESMLIDASEQEEGYRNGLGCGQVEEDTNIQHERITPQFGAVRDSEASTVRRLRSGKVFGTPSVEPMKMDYKKTKIQHETRIPNGGCTTTADLTSHENDSSAVGIVTEVKQESHDSHCKGRGSTVKKGKKRKRDSSKLFWNFV